jgi:hydrogenase expression/formation protein HypD
MVTAQQWLARIQDLSLHGRIRIMNVCGGHERSISMAGLRRALPGDVELIPGPGCPVCVCPEEDIFSAIQLAERDDIILAAFGDMLRVPCNAPRAKSRSLEQARAAGADVRPVSSPEEVLRIAKANPGLEVVFFAAGFETTMAPVAGLIAQGLPENLSILLSGRLTWPAVAMLLDSDTPGFNALIAPGHVSAVMGPEEWAFVAERHGIPAAVAGFTTESLLAAMYSVLRQNIEGRVFLDNCYKGVAPAGGNPTAQQTLAEVFDVTDAMWRGVGIIPDSGFSIKPELAGHDARHRFSIDTDEARRRAGEMPPGCDCARVVLGKIYPNQRLHPAKTRWTMHGFRRGRLPDLVVFRYSRARRRCRATEGRLKCAPMSVRGAHRRLGALMRHPSRHAWSPAADGYRGLATARLFTARRSNWASTAGC